MTQQLDLQLAQDHLESLTKVGKAILAVEELVWNALDADATEISIELHRNAFDGLETIRVIDNGSGIAREDLEQTFGTLGGSPKLNSQKTPSGRIVHGKEGKGRFRVFALGRHVQWLSRYKAGADTLQFTITGRRAILRTFEIGDQSRSPEDATGVTVEITNLEDFADSLLGENAPHELISRIALYVRAYPGITIGFDGTTLNCRDIEDYVATYDLVVQGEEQETKASLTVIEWKLNKIGRKLYLCNQAGFARDERPPAIQAKGFDFTAYLRSPSFDDLDDAEFGLEELHPILKSHLDAAKDQLRSHFRQREAERASQLVEQWKEDEVYPYAGETSDPVEQVERELFDVCALKIHQYLPGFDDSDTKSKKLTFNLLRQSLETGPSSVQTIFQEVLALPKEQQDELAELLQKTTLTAIINAAKVVTERLTFLVSLGEMLFSEDLKPRIKERSQLHRILVHELWIFGEQYSLGTDDESLTNVLRKHVGMLDRDELSPSVEVKDLDDRRAIPDLMLFRSYPQSTPNTYEHLVIELKRPTVKIGREEIGQIEGYAFTIAKDERFDKLRTKWTFVLLGNDLDDFAQEKCSETGKDFGHIHVGSNVNVWVKRWSQVIDEAKWKYEFFKEKLEYQVSTGDAVAYLKKKYAQYLPKMESVSSQEST